MMIHRCDHKEFAKINLRYPSFQLFTFLIIYGNQWKNDQVLLLDFLKLDNSSVNYVILAFHSGIKFASVFLLI